MRRVMRWRRETTYTFHRSKPILHTAQVPNCGWRSQILLLHQYRVPSTGLPGRAQIHRHIPLLAVHHLFQFGLLQFFASVDQNITIVMVITARQLSHGQCNLSVRNKISSRDWDPPWPRRLDKYQFLVPSDQMKCKLCF